MSQYNVYNGQAEYIVCADNEDEAINNVLNHRSQKGQYYYPYNDWNVDPIKYNNNGVFDVATG